MSAHLVYPRCAQYYTALRLGRFPGTTLKPRSCQATFVMSILSFKRKSVPAEKKMDGTVGGGKIVPALLFKYGSGLNRFNRMVDNGSSVLDFVGKMMLFIVLLR